MGNRFVSGIFTSDAGAEQFREMVIQAFRPLGGTITKTTTGLSLLGGKYGINFQSWADLNAIIMIRKLRDTNYEVQVYLNWSWGVLMWLALVFGVILGGLPWIYLIFYLFFDPGPAYQQALVRISYTLEPQQALKLY